MTAIIGWPTFGLLAVAIPGLILPVSAQDITMQDITNSIRTGMCPGNLTEVREFSWEAECGPKFYELTHEMRKCRAAVDEDNREIKAYNKLMRECKARKRNSGSTGNSNSYSGSRSGGSASTSGSPQSCTSISSVPASDPDKSGYYVTNNCSRPIELEYSSLMYTSFNFKTGNHPMHRVYKTLSLASGDSHELFTIKDGALEIGSISYARSSTGTRQSPDQDYSSSPASALPESTTSTENRQRYCSEWSSEAFDLCFECPNSRGECIDMEDVRSRCRRYFDQAQQNGMSVNDDSAFRACYRVGWWPPS